MHTTPLTLRQQTKQKSCCSNAWGEHNQITLATRFLSLCLCLCLGLHQKTMLISSSTERSDEGIITLAKSDAKHYDIHLTTILKECPKGLLKHVCNMNKLSSLFCCHSSIFSHAVFRCGENKNKKRKEETTGCTTCNGASTLHARKHTHTHVYARIQIARKIR